MSFFMKSLCSPGNKIHERRRCRKRRGRRCGVRCRRRCRRAIKGALKEDDKRDTMMAVKETPKEAMNVK